jgi:DNA-binding PadR family transcriptional regulator
VLSLFIKAPERERFGLEIITETGIPSGSLYPILHRFEERGFLDSSWEDFSKAVAEGRRPRKRYKLSSEKTQAARAQLAEWRSSEHAVTAPNLHPKIA